MERKNAIDQARELADKPIGVLVENQFLAQFVEPFNICAPLLGLAGLAARSLRHSAHNHATGRKGQHIHPLLRTGKLQRVQRQQEEEVERDRTNQRKVKRQRQARLRCRPDHESEIHHAGGGGVRMQPYQHSGGQSGHRGGHNPVNNPPRIGEPFHDVHHRNHMPLSRLV